MLRAGVRQFRTTVELIQILLGAKAQDMGLFSRLRKMKILLVDDDEWIRDSLSVFFEGEGCYLLALETAEEALQVLNRQSYDIIISDYRLPGMDGLELLSLVGNSHPHAMKVLVTAYGNNDVVSEASRIGIDHLIQKPFTIEAIEDSIAQLMEKREDKNHHLHARSGSQQRLTTA